MFRDDPQRRVQVAYRSIGIPYALVLVPPYKYKTQVTSGACTTLGEIYLSYSTRSYK
jgi:hypothetical protein